MLRSFQVQPARHLTGILQSGSNALDMSDTGTGKSYVAAAVAASLNVPTLCVVPKISVSMWHGVAAHFGTSFSVIGYEALRTGRSPYGRWENTPPPGIEREKFFVCEVCQRKVTLESDEAPCPHNPGGFHCISTKKKAWRYGAFFFSPETRLLIIDEIHRCGALDSLQADILLAAVRQKIPVLGLSATAACTPLGMRAIGAMLGLHSDNKIVPGLPTWRAWSYAHGCRFDPAFHGLIFHQPEERAAKIMRGIRSDILPLRGVRLTTDSIPGFPSRQITAELYDLEAPEKIDALYAEMSEPLASLATQAAQDANPELPLTKMLRARMKVEILKVPVLVELAEDAIAKGQSVAIFVSFRQTIELLAKKLKTDCVVTGGQDAHERSSNIAHFQTNISHIILLNSAAGGISVSLHDLHGRARLGLISPGLSAVEFRQICGRLHRDGSKSPSIYRVVLAAKTVETKMKASLDKKLDSMDSLLDGDLMPS